MNTSTVVCLFFAFANGVIALAAAVADAQSIMWLSFLASCGFMFVCVLEYFINSLE